jgi:hypothetical protein
MGLPTRYPPHVVEHLDVVIVGAGPAGLAAGVSLSGGCRSFAILEAGLQSYHRSRDKRAALIRGVGGAGLFSDGKFSFYPSASALWRLRDEALLKEAFQWSAGQIAEQGITAPEFPDLSASPPDSVSADGFKYYPSIFMPLEARQKVVEALSEKVGRALRTTSRAVAIRETPGGFLLHVETRKGIQAISSGAIIFAGGRFGPLELSRMMPDTPMVFRRYEVGIRLEQPEGSFIFRDHPSVDVKHIRPGEEADEEWRTFCTCRSGEVVETRWDDLRTFSGRSDGAKSGVSNLGINLRFMSPPNSEALLDELHNLVSGQLEPFRVPLRDFMGAGAAYLGAGLDTKFRCRLEELVPSEAISEAVVYGPCLEGVGFYPDVNDALKLNSHEVWIAGDAVGTFRGLTPALVSGFYCGRQVAAHLRNAYQVPSFVKESCVGPMPVVFTAQSKAYFYCRDAICEYVLKQGLLPINPFRVFEYFLGDRVDRDLVRQGNNQLISLADEVWVFGPVSDGVLFEVVRARRLRKPVRLFSVATRSSEIKPINIGDVKFEPEVHAAQITREDLIALLSDALPLAEKSPQLDLVFDDTQKDRESISSLP